jgi:hypothetical protein
MTGAATIAPFAGQASNPGASAISHFFPANRDFTGKITVSGSQTTHLRARTVVATVFVRFTANQGRA